MASRFVSVAFASAAILAALFSPLAAHAQAGCLTGSVVDNAGQPVEGIRITLGDNVWTSAQISPEPKSDESGQFRIEDIPPGTYQANASNDQLGYPGIWWPNRDVSIAPSSICTNITFNVRWRTAKLKLTVTDAATSKPIHDILLDVFPGDKPGLWLPVEPLLSYGLPPQVPSLTKLRIVVTAKGYSSSEFAFASLAPGATQEIVTTLSPKRMGCITGVAVDDNFAPVAEAKINPQFMGTVTRGNAPSPTTADDSGKFKLDNLQPGSYTLYAEKDSDGFSGFWSGWQGQVKLQKVTVTLGGACQEVTINMGARGAVLRVHAMDALTHEPLTTITVSFHNPENPRQGGSMIIGPRQYEEVPIPSRTNVTIRVRAPGYQPSDPITIDPLSPGEKQELTVPLRRETSAASTGP
jgi:Carboxypeptidase regulatory-like domain